MYNQIPYMMPNSANTLLGNFAGNSLKTSSLSSFFNKLNISSILSNTQKTLSVVNQAIPLYYQVKPVVKNLRTLGKIGKEFSEVNSNNNVIQKSKINSKPIFDDVTNNDVPTPKFYL